MSTAAFAAPALMPMPSQLTYGTGELSIDRGFSIAIGGACDARVTRGAQRLIAQIAKQTGIPITPDSTRPRVSVQCASAGKAVQALDEDESYRLEITNENAKLTAPNSLGALRGFATLLQLTGRGASGFAAPAVSIDDHPRFPWRGLHLDVSRHWMPMDVVLRNLDAMWAVKLNVFHWHLSDNQGFRVESKRFPKLQELGSDGNFYTQAQVREVIAYARDRGIRVLPEFDIPGHSTAMLAGYPELGAAPGPFQIGRTWGIFDPVMDPTRESVYQFLDAFIGEMASLFPDEYFHIGGDEVNGREWNTNAEIAAYKRAHGMSNNDQLQAYFNKRLLPIVTKYGKKMMGWDEIFQPDLPKDIVIQSWRGKKSLADAVEQGYQGLLSAGYYLDHMQSAADHYLVDPEIDPSNRQPRVLGGEVCMWTEYVTAENVDSRIWPRSAAIAERFWSPANLRNVPSMYARLEGVDRELDYLGTTQNSAYRLMLERLGPINSVQTLADVVWPVDLGGRARAGKYTQQTPLNRLVDAARPDPPLAREFAAQVAGHNYEAVRAQLSAWKNNPAPPGEEMESLQRQLAQIAVMGLRALDYIAKKEAAPSAWVAQSKAELTAFKKPRAEIRFAIIDPILMLVSNAGEVVARTATPAPKPLKRTAH